MMDFALPPEITITKHQLDGRWVYSFRHDNLGELGRIVLQQLAVKQCNIVCEVAGDPGDPLTRTRLSILKPISEQITAVMASVLGHGDQARSESAPATPMTPSEVVENKLIPCERCGYNAALLIFAYDARTAADFEDYARKMYPKIKALNVPTWIIGEALGVEGFETPSSMLKVWPYREALRQMTPTDFNLELDELLAKHCP